MGRGACGYHQAIRARGCRILMIGCLVSLHKLSLMEQQKIIQLLTEDHLSFVHFIDNLPTEQFLFSKQEKWTAGQQLDHIYRSVSPVVLAFGLPKFLLPLIFGKANRVSRSFEELVEKYQAKLAGGGKASGRFIPKAISINQKETINRALTQKIDQLCSKIRRFTEPELDAFILPHPLLGKLTLREMLYFTIYHVRHHKKLIQNSLEAAN
jgi:hypothetical protein